MRMLESENQTLVAESARGPRDDSPNRCSHRLTGPRGHRPKTPVVPVVPGVHVSGLFTSSHSPNLPQMDQNTMCSFRGIVQHFNRDASDHDSGGTSKRFKSLEVDCWERRKGKAPAVRYRGAIPLFVPIWRSWRLRPGLGKLSCLWSR
jgi:hypothetical protein